jgi:hypothetical protein
MNLDRKGVGVLAATLALVGLIFWTSSGEPVSDAPSQPELPIVQVEMKADLEQFIQQLHVEPFPSLGLVKAEAVDRALLVGWDSRWLSLPGIYRRELVEKLGRPWAYYMGGTTVVYGVPDGAEIARYTAEDGAELVGNQESARWNGSLAGNRAQTSRF